MLFFELGQEMLSPLELFPAGLETFDPLSGLLPVAIDVLQRRLMFGDRLFGLLDLLTELVDTRLSLRTPFGYLLEVGGFALELFGNVAASQLALLALDLLAVESVTQGRESVDGAEQATP